MRWCFGPLALTKSEFEDIFKNSLSYLSRSRAHFCIHAFARATLPKEVLNFTKVCSSPLNLLPVHHFFFPWTAHFTSLSISPRSLIVSSKQKWQQMKSSLLQTRGAIQELLSRRWQQKSKIPSVPTGVSLVDDFWSLYSATIADHGRPSRGWTQNCRERRDGQSVWPQMDVLQWRWAIQDFPRILLSFG